MEIRIVYHFSASRLVHSYEKLNVYVQRKFLIKYRLFSRSNYSFIYCVY